MTGAFSSSHHSTIAWSNSILLTLNAPMAYLPLRALAKSSLVVVSGINSTQSSNEMRSTRDHTAQCRRALAEGKQKALDELASNRDGCSPVTSERRHQR